MIITLDTIIRTNIGTTSFADITAVPCVRIEWFYDETTSEERWELEFAGDLTTREQWGVRVRCRTADSATETLILSILDAFATLRQIKNSGNSTTLNNAQLSEAARANSAAILRLGKLMLGDFIPE